MTRVARVHRPFVASASKLIVVVLLFAVLPSTTPKPADAQNASCAQPTAGGCPLSPSGDVSWSGASLTKTLASTSQPDWWTVTVPEGFGLAVALQSPSEDYDLHLRSPTGSIHESVHERESNEHVLEMRATPGKWDIFVEANRSRVEQGVVQGGKDYILTPTLIAHPGNQTIVSRVSNSDGTFRVLVDISKKGTFVVYLGDQPVDLSLGFSSVRAGLSFGSEPSGMTEPCGLGIGSCFRVQATVASTEGREYIIQRFAPDYRVVETEPGMYVVEVLPAGAFTSEALAETFTLNVAQYPRVCALIPANMPSPSFPGMTLKPDIPDFYQIGLAFQPDASELGPFSLMTFMSFVSPPFSDLFDYTWELDGKVLTENQSTIQYPYSSLERTPLGLHTVKLTVHGAREYVDLRSGLRHTPFDGGSRSVVCQFRGQV